MDCNKAAEATLQYMEKTIKPATAKALALHLLGCESCREYFTALDMTMDALDEGALEFSEAPEGFTEAVMEKVSALPVYREKKKEVTNYKLIIRIAGGLSTVIMGVVLMLTSGMTTVTNDGLFAALKGWVDGVYTYFTQDGAGTLSTLFSSVPMLSISALVLGAVISALLFTLQRSDHGGKVKA